MGWVVSCVGLCGVICAVRCGGVDVVYCGVVKKFSSIHRAL